MGRREALPRGFVRTLKSFRRRLFGFPPPGRPLSCLTPENLYAYLDALYKKRGQQGSVLEVGCASGATAAIAFTFLARQGIMKEYVCVDTFLGFLEDHLYVDRRMGLPKKNEGAFSDSSIERVAYNLKSWGIPQIRLVEGNIAAIDIESLPNAVSVCLMDVDLKIPTLLGLERIYPLLEEGGVILVDDCTWGTTWVGALQGYKEFAAHHGLREKYFMGFGVVEKYSPLSSLDWAISDHPMKETNYLFGAANPIAPAKEA